MLDLRHLQYFVAVAEEEHMGRAAERLHISQSPLSRQIAQLEKRLGLALFERIQQRLRLTEDGRTLLDEARALLAQASRVEALAHRLSLGDQGALGIGYVDNAVHSGILPDTLRALQAGHPGIKVELHYQHSLDLIEALRQRKLDVALVCEPPAPGDADIAAQQLLTDPMLLAVPADHPLAGKQHISPADLHGQKWISVINHVHSPKPAVFIAACERAGFTPDLALRAAEPLAALGLVAAGLGVTMIQQGLRQQAPDGVVLHELPWFGFRIPLYLAWHRVNLRSIVEVFRSTLLATHADQPAPRMSA